MNDNLLDPYAWLSFNLAHFMDFLKYLHGSNTRNLITRANRIAKL